ncbi:MAG: SMP-30/gluconolactonase/LRE family protein [Gammaproteobacteria bacterium]|nr:SMP-30/gluconolactonase/LRE family protein [Gammaproteobacteria bacterium]
MSAEPGDIFLAATDVDDRNVDLRNHSGPGRVLHYDAQLRLKGELRTGQVGLVIGLGWDRRHRELLVTDPSAHVVTRFAADGSRLEPLPFLPRARIGSIQFLPDGRFCAGVHSKHGEDPASPQPKLYLCDREAGSALPLAVDIDGGKFRFHAVTHMTLAPDGHTLLYVSETGRRVMRYDLAAQRQLDDLLVLAAADPRGTYGLACTPDGRVLMATGSGAAMFAADGSLIRSYDIPERRGWSRLQLSLDPTRFWLSNFFEGVLQQRDVESGELIREHDIGRKYSLCGLAEVTA